MNEIESVTIKLFEDIKHIDESGNEYWSARELQIALHYAQWRRFNDVIEKSIISCINVGANIDDHFARVGKMVQIGVSTKIIDDFKLSRYGCYLIAQNADSRKKVISFAQTYFAIQTRKQELYNIDDANTSEDEKRLRNRLLIKCKNKSLNTVAVKSGVKDLARFHNAGYKGLYNGETANDIFKRKKLIYRQDILDFMCNDELILNLFRVSQIEQKLRNNNIDNEYEASLTHYNVGKGIRNLVEQYGNTLPEDMPTPHVSAKELSSKYSRNNIED